MSVRIFSSALQLGLALAMCQPVYGASGTCSELAQDGEAETSFGLRLSAAALARLQSQVRYDGSYRRLDYPGGDVPSSVGVCTDLVIRSYRALGFDFQKAVHEDMVQAFDAYPDLWGLQQTDSNIDHRRVPNLERFLERRGSSLQISGNPDCYQPGDLVSWRLPGGLPHIGIVVDRRSPEGRHPLIVHNIGNGPELGDVLFAYPIHGHYRFRP